MKKKSDPRDPADELSQSPISFHPSSNGEFEPRPVSDRDRRAAALYRDIVEHKARRLGMSRRAFTESASGMVAALFVLNKVYGCSADPKKRRGSEGSGGFSRDAGFDVGQDVGPEDAAQANADARYDAGNGAAVYGVDPDLMRQKITQDQIEDQIDAITLAHREEPQRSPRGTRPHGPRTRREYLAFLRWSGELG